MLNDLSLQKGKWESVSCTINDQQVLATGFRDIQDKDFISTCRAKLCGDPRVTRNGDYIHRPDVASFYLRNAAAVDIHNHFQNGGTGFEDVVEIKDSVMRQLTALIGFMECNGFLLAKYKGHSPNPIPGLKSDHASFKIRLSNLMIYIQV